MPILWSSPLFRSAAIVWIMMVLPVTLLYAQGSTLPEFPGTIIVDVEMNLERLIEEEDTDGDKKITIDDIRVGVRGRGDKRFLLRATNGRNYEIDGNYYLSNLLQELTLAKDVRITTSNINPEHIFENPVERISRLIREVYWNGLTRSIDASHIEQVLKDEKLSATGVHYLYVPHEDAEAFSYFSELERSKPNLHLHVEKLPAEITPIFVRDLTSRHGLLSLKLEKSSERRYVGVPFVVPGGRFNEMYGWDSYFEALGLLIDGRVDLAKAMVDNFVYQIAHYGKILNANRTYYLTRSQPPFLTSMALAVYDNIPRTEASKKWLRGVIIAAINEYYEVWTNRDRLTATGLSRYYGTGMGPPPEVEAGHFDAIFQAYASSQQMEPQEFEKAYRSGAIESRELDSFFVHDRCVRESGHDTTYRWNWGGDRCADFVTVDLNSLLHKVEVDIGSIIDQEFGGDLDLPDGSRESAHTWYTRAAHRRALIQELLWDPQRGMFFDYDTVKQARHKYVSATTFYPLWAWNGTDRNTQIVGEEQAKRIVAAALPLLEMPGGVAASTEESRGPVLPSRPARQWDYPNGWAPHQILIWRGLLNYGFDEIAHRLIYRWLYTITRNAVDYNGTIPEKFDVVSRSHKVFAEYGNVGTKFDYITREGFGWMNASFQVGLRLLPANLRYHLERLVPPEWLFER